MLTLSAEGLGSRIYKRAITITAGDPVAPRPLGEETKRAIVTETIPWSILDASR